MFRARTEHETFSYFYNYKDAEIRKEHVRQAEREMFSSLRTVHPSMVLYPGKHFQANVFPSVIKIILGQNPLLEKNLQVLPVLC